MRAVRNEVAGSPRHAGLLLGTIACCFVPTVQIAWAQIMPSTVPRGGAIDDLPSVLVLLCLLLLLAGALAALSLAFTLRPRPLVGAAPGDSERRGLVVGLWTIVARQMMPGTGFILIYQGTFALSILTAIAGFIALPVGLALLTRGVGRQCSAIAPLAQDRGLGRTLTSLAWAIALSAGPMLLAAGFGPDWLAWLMPLAMACLGVALIAVLAQAAGAMRALDGALDKRG